AVGRGGGGGLVHRASRAPDATSPRVGGPHPPLSKKLLTAVPVILGPTGIGKSQVAFDLALQLGGEIVVADSRQVYQRLDIATNKPSDEHRRQVRYHMIDFVDPATNFNAAHYVEGARGAIDDIASRRMTPIVEGGAMLYVA